MNLLAPDELAAIAKKLSKPQRLWLSYWSKEPGRTWCPYRTGRALCKKGYMSRYSLFVFRTVWASDEGERVIEHPEGRWIHEFSPRGVGWQLAHYLADQRQAGQP